MSAWHLGGLGLPCTPLTLSDLSSGVPWFGRPSLATAARPRRPATIFGGSGIIRRWHRAAQSDSDFSEGIIYLFQSRYRNRAIGWSRVGASRYWVRRAETARCSTSSLLVAPGGASGASGASIGRLFVNAPAHFRRRAEQACQGKSVHH
jgi:hypothetical protein